MSKTLKYHTSKSHTVRCWNFRKWVAFRSSTLIEAMAAGSQGAHIVLAKGFDWDPRKRLSFKRYSSEFPMEFMLNAHWFQHITCTSSSFFDAIITMSGEQNAKRIACRSYLTYHKSTCHHLLNLPTGGRGWNPSACSGTFKKMFQKPIDNTWHQAGHPRMEIQVVIQCVSPI